MILIAQGVSNGPPEHSADDLLLKTVEGQTHKKMKILKKQVLVPTHVGKKLMCR